MLTGAESARIAILGTGGIGKTSLARAAIHQPAVIQKYAEPDQLLFVSAGSTTNAMDLANHIAVHIGLKPQRNPSKAVINYLSSRKSCLLVLDNLETAWEPATSRTDIEELLSLLTDILHLSLIVCQLCSSKIAGCQPTYVPEVQPDLCSQGRMASPHEGSEWTIKSGQQKCNFDARCL